MKAKVLFPPGNVLRSTQMVLILLVCSITAWADQNEVDSISAKVAQSRPTTASSDLAAVEERRSITRELLTLAKSGASPERISEWQETNATRLASNQQKLAEISARQKSGPKLHVPIMRIPDGASRTVETFLTERAKLRNDQIRVENQTLLASPESRGEALKVWRKMNAGALGNQQDLAEQISAESATRRLPFPVSPNIPADATPELRDFITRHHALMKERLEMIATLEKVSPQQRQQALQDWEIENSARLHAMHEAALQLSPGRNSSR